MFYDEIDESKINNKTEAKLQRERERVVVMEKCGVRVFERFEQKGML